jgi:hypothetical protein
MTGPVRSGKHDPAGTVPGDSSIGALGVSSVEEGIAVARARSRGSR